MTQKNVVHFYRSIPPRLGGWNILRIVLSRGVSNSLIDFFWRRLVPYIVGVLHDVFFNNGTHATTYWVRARLYGVRVRIERHMAVSVGWKIQKCSGAELVHSWQVVAQTFAGSQATLLALRKCRRWLMLKIAACGQERQTKRERQERAMCAGKTIPDQLTFTTTEMCPTRRCTCRPTATFLDACAYKLSYVLRQCPYGWPKPLFQYLSYLTTYVLVSSNYWLYVVVVPHYSYLTTPRCSCILLPSSR